VAENRHPEREPGVRRKGYTVMLALALFACLGGLPAILSAAHLKISTAPPTTSGGIKLLGAPRAPRAVPLPPIAMPVNPTLPTATFPPVSESLEAAAVAREDNRLRTMLHDSFRTFQPKIVPYSHSLPTLLLTSGTQTVYSGGFRYVVHGQSSYTAADLIREGAMARLPDGGALLEDNVFVASGARLELSSSDVAAIFLDTTASGSASIVGWGGSLDFRGTRHHPLTISGWNESRMTPATDTGNGRPYIREVAGAMTFENARVSTLGFWSGRTGGVAWTGLSTHQSFGGATATTFTGNTYGAFVTRGSNLRFWGDLFESSQIDGLHIHRGSVGAQASFSAAVRNGANGFHVDRATTRTVLLDDVSQHNASNGFLVDGRPLVVSASASGKSVTPGSGTRIENSAALHNGRTGILIEGGNRTLLKANEVCARLTGIALRYGASNAIVNGNDVRCGPRVGLSVGPSAPATLMSGNAVSGARIGVLVTNSGRVEMDNSLVTRGAVFGISVRGVNSVVVGKDNVFSGTGYRAVDARADAKHLALSASNTADWAYAPKGTVLTYLEFHPLAVFWLSVAFLVIAGGRWTRRRRLPPHPYPESTRWTGTAHAPVPVAAYAGAQPDPSSSHDRWAWMDGEIPDRSEIFELGLLDGPLHVDRRLARLRLEDTRPHGGHPGRHRPASRPGHGRSTDSTGPLPRLDY
jgi:Right handed beta helix region